MDRNIDSNCNFSQKRQSLSARRAWIEIAKSTPEEAKRRVALRKESVDRNMVVALLAVGRAGRSPQGERG